MTTATPVEATLRAKIRRAIDAMSMDDLDQVAVWAGSRRLGLQFEQIAAAEIDVSIPEVKAYWNAPCTCCAGSLN